MKTEAHYIEKIIHAIDWRKIKSYYKKLEIHWEYQDDKQTVKKTPSVAELKDDFRSILSHMLDQNINYISYGSWIVFWDRDEGALGDIRVIFRLADFIFEDDKSSAENLAEKLKKAVESEDYEYAAVIRDELKNISIS